MPKPGGLLMATTPHPERAPFPPAHINALASIGKLRPPMHDKYHHALTFGQLFWTLKS